MILPRNAIPAFVFHVTSCTINHHTNFLTSSHHIISSVLRPKHTRNPTNPLDAQSDNPQSAAKPAILLIRSIRKATIRNPQQCLRSFEEVIRFDHHHAPSTSLPPIKQHQVPSIIPSLKWTPSSNPPAVCLLSGQNRDSVNLYPQHTHSLIAIVKHPAHTQPHRVFGYFIHATMSQSSCKFVNTVIVKFCAFKMSVGCRKNKVVQL